MRERDRILGSLEKVYREAYDEAVERDDEAAMARMDLEYQRDQLWFEVLLDLRDLLTEPDDSNTGDRVGSLIDKAQALKNLTRRR